MKKLIIFLLFSSIACVVSAQSQKPVEPKLFYDTTTTLCKYMSDSATQETSEAKLQRVVIYKYDYTQPTPEELANDSVTLHKKRILMGYTYTLFYKNKSTGKMASIVIPNDYIITDYNYPGSVLDPKNHPTLSPDPFRKIKSQL